MFCAETALFDTCLSPSTNYFEKMEGQFDQEFMNFKKSSSILTKGHGFQRSVHKINHHFFKKVHEFEKSSPDLEKKFMNLKKFTNLKKVHQISKKFIDFDKKSTLI